jgi:diacylglycerol kinase family enzyme
MRAKLIFNPSSGRMEQSAGQLVDILTEMQAWHIIPEVYLIHPRSQVKAVVRDAIDRGIRLIVVSGGDGTIDSVVDTLVGTNARLGIIPTGTRNNVAMSLDIPVGNIPEAVSLLRRGRSLRVDVGYATSGHAKRYFFEAASIGLISALYPAADDIQHGNLARIGDLLTTLVGMPVAEMHLKLDDGVQKIVTQAHVVLIGNMPFFATNLRLSQDVSFIDGLLDVFVFSNLTKLDLLGYAVQVVGGGPTDPRVQHFQVRNLEVRALPRMPVMADGFMLGEGPLRVSVRRHALAVMAAQTALAKLAAQTQAPVEEDTDAA